MNPPTRANLQAASHGLTSFSRMSHPPSVVLTRPNAIRAPNVVGVAPQQRRPVIVGAQGNQHMVRVQGPGVVGPRQISNVQGKNIVINQPGMRPGAPGAQITVPLATLQNLQPGQMIPTGHQGHLLVKTENGQYQILKVGQSTAGGAGVSGVVTTMAPRPTVATSVVGAMTPKAPVMASAARPPTAVASAAAGGTGGMGQQMTPDTAKLKCKNFLATLLRLASEQPPNVAANVRGLIQGLIDGKVEPEVFTNRLQAELNSSPQPCLVPFLKKSLPYLQQSLRNGDLTIDGVRAPPRVSTAPQQHPIQPSHLGAAVRIHRPQTNQAVISSSSSHSMTQRPPISIVNHGMRTPGAPLPGLGVRHGINVMSGNSLIGAKTTVNTQINKSAALGTLGARSMPLTTPMPALSSMSSLTSASSPNIKKEKVSSSSSFSTAGDEDINDVAAMGGVNLDEESQRMQGATDRIGTQIRSCKDETFLQTGLLQTRIAKICRDRGLDEPSADVVALMSHAAQERLKTLVEKLSVIAEHRMDIIKLEGEQYEVVHDVRGQIKFLSDIDKLERRRHEEAERELLLRAAKSRTKTEDPEKEKLKAKAKEMQRLEEEQLRHEKANNTALLAIGGPKKKLRLDEGSWAMSTLGSKSGLNTSTPMRPRIKRVNMRDLMFLMEQEKDLKRSPLLFKAYSS